MGASCVACCSEPALVQLRRVVIVERKVSRAGGAGSASLSKQPAVAARRRPRRHRWSSYPYQPRTGGVNRKWVEYLTGFILGEHGTGEMEAEWSVACGFVEGSATLPSRPGTPLSPHHAAALALPAAVFRVRALAAGCLRGTEASSSPAYSLVVAACLGRRRHGDDNRGVHDHDHYCLSSLLTFRIVVSNSP